MTLLRCLWANKAFMFGFVVFLSGLALTVTGIDREDGGWMMLWSFFLVGATNFGKDTVRAYLRTTEALEEWGEPRKAYEFYATAEYCYRVGYQLAIRDFERRKTIEAAAPRSQLSQ